MRTPTTTHSSGLRAPTGAGCLRPLNEAQSASPLAASSNVANKQDAVNRTRRKAAVLMWGIASGAGFLIAAATNVLLLHSIAAEGSTVPPLEIDLLLTGLIIGAGTKPVHDLVSRIEKSKSNAEDKAVRARSAPGPAATLPRHAREPVEPAGTRAAPLAAAVPAAHRASSPSRRSDGERQVESDNEN